MTSAMRNNNLISDCFAIEVIRHAHVAAGPNIPGSHHRPERLRHQAARLDPRTVNERRSDSLDTSQHTRKHASDPGDDTRSD